MSLARVGENKGARKPANLLFEGLFSGVALRVMVVYFQCLWTASWATPLQTSSDSDSEEDDFSSPLLHFSLVQLSLSVSLSE